MTVPDYLVIGTITKDLLPDGFSVGGTVTFASITARRLGKNVAIVTSASSDLVLPPELEGIQCLRVPSPKTTTFRNIYVDGTRKQYLEARCEPIRAEDIPVEWRKAPLVHLAPLAGEIDESIIHLFPNSRVIATPQGWFRSWDETGFVSLGSWPGASRLLPHLDAAVLSIDDTSGDLSSIPRFARMSRILVITHGASGSRVYFDGREKLLPPRPAREVDPTGAGDVFAAAFLVRLHEVAQASGLDDPWDAALFANVAASFSVEGCGYSSIPRRQQVEAFLACMDEKQP